MTEYGVSRASVGAASSEADERAGDSSGSARLPGEATSERTPGLSGSLFIGNKWNAKAANDSSGPRYDLQALSASGGDWRSKTLRPKPGSPRHHGGRGSHLRGHGRGPPSRRDWAAPHRYRDDKRQSTVCKLFSLDVVWVLDVCWLMNVVSLARCCKWTGDNTIKHNDVCHLRSCKPRQNTLKLKQWPLSAGRGTGQDRLRRFKSGDTVGRWKPSCRDRNHRQQERNVRGGLHVTLWGGVFLRSHALWPADTRQPLPPAGREAFGCATVSGRCEEEGEVSQWHRGAHTAESGATAFQYVQYHQEKGEPHRRWAHLQSG